MNSNEKIWKYKMPYDVIIHCITPFLVPGKNSCLIEKPHDIIFCDKEIYESCLKYLPECREKNKINFYGQKICEQHNEIKFKLVADFLLKKRDDKSSDRFLSQFNLPYSAFTDPPDSKYGQYHASPELIEYVKGINNGVFDKNTIQTFYSTHSIFQDAPYIIKNTCCSGIGFKYRIMQ